MPPSGNSHATDPFAGTLEGAEAIDSVTTLTYFAGILSEFSRILNTFPCGAVISDPAQYGHVLQPVGTSIFMSTVEPPSFSPLRGLGIWFSLTILNASEMAFPAIFAPFLVAPIAESCSV